MTVVLLLQGQIKNEGRGAKLLLVCHRLTVLSEQKGHKTCSEERSYRECGGYFVGKQHGSLNVMYNLFVQLLSGIQDTRVNILQIPNRRLNSSTDNIVAESDKQLLLQARSC